MKKFNFIFSTLSVMAALSLSAEEAKSPMTTTEQKPAATEVAPQSNAMPKVAPKEEAPVPAEQAKAQRELNWMTNYKEAVTVAKRDNKPLFLFFTGSDWCGWCKKMESEVFSTPEFSKKAGNRFVFVMLDYPMNKPVAPEIKKQNQELKQRFGVSGYPTVIILDPSENFIAETGYRPGGGAAYADYILGLLP